MKNVSTNASNLKSKVDKLDGDKVVPVPVDLSKLSEVIKNDVIKKDAYDANIKKIEIEIPNVANFATNGYLSANIYEVKGEIPCVTNLATNSAPKTKIMLKTK